MKLAEWQTPRAMDRVLTVVVLLYAFCAGLRTIGDFDFGWQIASGRYVAQHHHIPFADALAYTVPGIPWLYPPLAGLIFYLLYLLGGYAALSWLLAVAVVSTMAFLIRRAGAATAAAAILAVPSILFRENPRAELFTTFLFAVYLSILWRYFRQGSGRLWLLPLLMLCWVNLHPGFISGLALLGGYVLLELCELFFVDRCGAAKARLLKAWPWLMAAFAMTVLNPWGPRIYVGIVRQSQSVKELGNFVGEWSRPNLSFAVFHQMARVRDPESSFWWLLIVVLIALVVAMRQKQIGPAIFLVGAGILSLQYLRFQGLFACVAVIVGGAMLDELASPAQLGDATHPKLGVVSAVRLRLLPGVAIALFLLSGVRCADLLTNRHYIEGGEVVLFGPGEASWFPERAAGFIQSNRLPGNIFNDYNSGGFLEWRLPEYRAYVDSRAIPFGVELIHHERTLLRTPLDSPEWTREADKWNINLIVLSLDRYTGLGLVSLPDDCRSRNWRPLYLDESSAVFMRNTAANAERLQQLAIDCGTVQLIEPEKARGNSYRAQANAYNFLANAGALFYLLGRDREAQQYLAQAEQIQVHDSNLHLTLAQLYQADNRPEDAEREYKASIEQRPTDFGWYLLGVLYGKEHRYPEAVDAVLNSAAISYNPADRYRVVGQIENVMQQPKEALAAFDHAERVGPQGNIEESKIFRAQLASGRAQSWELLHDLDRAIEEQRTAVNLQPNDAARWAKLANLYREKGETSAAAEAQAKANSLSAAAAQ